MANFGDNLRKKSTESKDKQQNFFTMMWEGYKLERKADEILKDYISEDERDLANRLCAGFKHECEKKAEEGHTSVRFCDYSPVSQNIISAYLPSISKQKAEHVKMLLEKELSEMGFQRYKVSFSKTSNGRGSKYYYFTIDAKW